MNDIFIHFTNWVRYKNGLMHLWKGIWSILNEHFQRRGSVHVIKSHYRWVLHILQFWDNRIFHFWLHLTKNNIFSFLKIAFCTVMRLLKLHYLTSFVWPNSCFTNIKTFSVMGLPTHATHIRDRKIAQSRCKQKTKLWWNDWYLVSTILEDSRQFLYSSYQFVCSAVSKYC